MFIYGNLTQQSSDLAPVSLARADQQEVAGQWRVSFHVHASVPYEILRRNQVPHLGADLHPPSITRGPIYAAGSC